MRAGRAAAAEKQSMVSPESLTATSTTASTVSARPSGPSHCGSAPGTVSHVYGPSPRRASRTARTAHHALSAAIPDPTASAATASGLDLKGATRAVALRAIVVPAVPSSTCLTNPPICVPDPPKRKSAAPNAPTMPTAATAMTTHHVHPGRAPARPAARTASARTRVSAPPTSAPNAGAPSTTSARTPGTPTPNPTSTRRSRNPRRAADGPTHAAIATRSAAAASAKAVLDTP